MASATLAAAIAFELEKVPVTATTLSCVKSLVIAFAASEGSLLLSATTALICLPSKPPLALISLIASLAPFAAAVPIVALPPVISFSKPILISLLDELPQPATDAAKITVISEAAAAFKKPFFILIESPFFFKPPRAKKIKQFRCYVISILHFYCKIKHFLFQFLNLYLN